jgi:hypothetical protein
MADPVSVLALISASLTITMRTATIGKDLHVLTSKFKRADQDVKQLSVHVSALRVTARALCSWLEGESVGSDDVEEVKESLLEVLSEPMINRTCATAQSRKIQKP